LALRALVRRLSNPGAPFLSTRVFDMIGLVLVAWLFIDLIVFGLMWFRGRVEEVNADYARDSESGFF
jgi:hypothetical protein